MLYRMKTCSSTYPLTFPLTVAVEAECSRPADRLFTPYAGRATASTAAPAPASPANCSDGSALPRAPSFVARGELPAVTDYGAPVWVAGGALGNLPRRIGGRLLRQAVAASALPIIPSAISC
jgi:hypothetical protein